MRQKGDTHTTAQPTQLRTAWTDRRLSGTFSWLVHSNDQVHVSDSLIFSWLKRLLIITTHALRQISQKSYWTVQALSARHTTPLPTAESWRQPFSDCNHVFLELTVHCVIWICIVKKTIRGIFKFCVQSVIWGWSENEKWKNYDSASSPLPLICVSVFMGVDCRAAKA